MTTDKTPSDAAIEELARPYIRSVGSYWENDDAIPDDGSIEDFARAVLAKWGQPSPAGEASVGSEMVYQARYQKGFWQDSSRERYEYLQNPENTCADDWETRILYTHPPTAQAQWRRPIETAPKDGTRILVHPAIEVADAWSKAHWSAQNECWIVGGSASGVAHTYWLPLPPAPPTTPAGSGKGE